MSELNKRFHLVYTKVAGHKAGECKECMGSKCAEFDECCYQKDNDDMCYSDEAACDDFKPCPTCAPLRELAESEWEDGEKECPVCHNSTHANTYTIQTIKATLEKLGERKGFEDWHDHQATGRITEGRMTTWSYNIYVDFDILTTDSLMLEAACAYLEGV